MVSRQAPARYGLSAAQTAKRLRTERDAYANRLDAAERRIADLKAENDAYRRIFADAIDHALEES